MSREQEEKNLTETRFAFLRELHKQVTFAGSWVIIPALVMLYAANAVRHPCWQTKVLLALALVMGVAWRLGFRAAEKGQVTGVVVLIVSTGMPVLVAAGTLRAGSSVSTAIGLITLLTYVSLFSLRALVVSAGIGGLAMACTAVVNHLDLVPKLVTTPREQLIGELAFILVFVPIATFFLHHGQRVNGLLFNHMERNALLQRELIGAVREVGPQLQTAVSEIKRASSTVASQASQQQSTSRDLLQATERMVVMIGTSAGAAEKTREISEKTRDDSLASRQRLEQVEASFQGAVERIESVREHIGQLAARLTRTAEVNQAIRGIAENLKVLAVNTSLEAAKAGEFGKGFSVVAQELHRLVGQSSEDLRSSLAMLQQLQTQAEQIAGEADAGTATLRGSFDQLRETGALIQRITDSFLLTSGKVDEVASAAEQEREHIRDISDAMRLFEASAKGLYQAAGELGEGVRRIDQAQADLRTILENRPAGFQDATSLIKG